MTVNEKITAAVKMYNGANEKEIVAFCKNSGFTKMQMSAVARKTGINRDLFWTAPKTEKLPADYWNQIEDAMVNPEKYGIRA